MPECLEGARQNVISAATNMAVGVLSAIGEATGVSSLIRAVSGRGAGGSLSAGTRAVEAGLTVLAVVPGSTAGTTGGRIARGHAFSKHVVQGGEFTGLGIRTVDQFGSFIDDVIGKASGGNVRRLGNNRTAYWDDATGTAVIRDPGSADFGTAFRPSGGRAYFDGLK